MASVRGFESGPTAVGDRRDRAYRVGRKCVTGRGRLELFHAADVKRGAA